MKGQMKFLIASVFVSLLLSSIFVISCKKKDKCDGISCETGYSCIDGQCILTDICNTCKNGTCVDDTCQCNSGYEGQTCSVEKRAKFFGTFNCVRQDNGGSPIYFESTIIASPNKVTEAIVKNFGGFTPSIDVTVSMPGEGFWAMPYNTTFGNITIVGGNCGLDNNKPDHFYMCSFSYKVGGGTDIYSGIEFTRK